MQGRDHSTIVYYVEWLMTQQIEQDHFAFGEHQAVKFSENEGYKMLPIGLLEN
jgi:hypothetical protein